MTYTAARRDPAVAAYLDALDRALADLPPSRRYEIVEDIAEHIDTADDPDVSRVLLALGDPSAIAAEALVGEPSYRRPQRAPPRGVVMEAVAIVLLALGGFVFFVGWFVGVAMLWASPRFTLKDKLFGTLLVPGGFAALFALLILPAFGSGTVTSCESIGDRAPVCTTTGGSGPLTTVVVIALAVTVLVGPIYTCARLTRRLVKVRHGSV